MKLKYKLLLFIVLVGSVFAVTVYAISKRIIDSVVEELVWRYAQIAVQYDAESTLATILSEVRLVQQVANNPNLTTWLENADDQVYQSVGLESLEQFRWQLRSKNYFVVADSTLSYYYSGPPSDGYKNAKRYQLEPQAVTDRWYFEQKQSGDELRVNIATDAHMKITKVWINQAVMKNGLFVGVVGTGVDMGLLLEKLSKGRPDALHTVFVDSNEKVQLSLEAENVEFPLRDSQKNKPYLNEILQNPEDYATLQTLMIKQRREQEPSKALVEKGSRNAIAAIEFIEPLQWYKITFVDVNRMMPVWVTPFLYLTLLFSSLFVGFASYLVLKREFVKPIEFWSRRLASLANIVHSEHMSVESNVERSVVLLEGELAQSRKGLEQMVSMRTAALDQMATFDVLTQLHNKRGIERELQAELSRANREQYQFGLMWVDAGIFTEDGEPPESKTYQSALQFIAEGLRAAIREYDIAARWGDDEFLLLVRSSERKVLRKIALRLQEYTSSILPEGGEIGGVCFSLSVGGAVISSGMNQKQALAMADSALYRAKKIDERIYIHTTSSESLNFVQTLI